uniref:Hexosyltransferase n=1 Tax=Caenorhabditis japonica TaxID=281687 RepID=A0A8R1ESH0_CAEJA
MLRYIIPRKRGSFVIALLITFAFLFVVFYHRNDHGRRMNLKFRIPDIEKYAEELVRFPETWNGKLHQIPDYTKPREGPGENGVPVILAKEETELGNADMKKWFMNVHAADKISLDRNVPDPRIQECKDIKYDLERLPKVSVIIIFTDEAWTPLLRTVHSVINRSPPQLLQEIILLDDN